MNEQEALNQMIAPGTKFGRLSVVEIIRGKGNVSGYVLCACSCGRNCKTTKSLLRRGLAVSCGQTGCKNVKRVNKRRKDNRYSVWTGMLARCNNRNSKDYKNYGQRGVSVCSRWESFELFCEDMGPRPSPQHSIDRIDNNGNYCPENCRWATPVRQSNNKRNNVVLTLNGQSNTIAEWSRELGINVTTLHYRYSAGMSVEDILCKKDRRHERRTSIDFNGSARTNQTGEMDGVCDADPSDSCL